MSKEKFKFFEHTADVEFEAYGKTLKKAFANAALAMFEIMTDTKEIKPKIKKEIEVESEDLEALLYDYLEELLVIHEIENLVFSKFKIESIEKEDKKDNYRLKGYAEGEKYNPEKHESRTAVKAVTYNSMFVKETKEKSTVHVVLDV